MDDCVFEDDHLDVEKRIGISLQLRVILVHRMLERCRRRRHLEKQRVYDVIVDYLEIEGYPTEPNPDFKPTLVTWFSTPSVQYSPISDT